MKWNQQQHRKNPKRPKIKNRQRAPVLLKKFVVEFGQSRKYEDDRLREAQ
jgi:hypothetical protein